MQGQSVDLKLKQVVEKIERLEEEKSEILEQEAAVYREAKALGFDVKIIRKVISIRKKDANRAREEEDLLELYKKSLGMI
ncbi:MAG: DUF2312 domain-containing protein [Rickettsiales bacterium]|jgi:uncharacterized protein (UPF0335 family)|nr:DUF2312 domain-containing protein [Rickettsiales bacterium]